MSKIIPVLLSGGAGTRLWPLSREGLPKQLLSLTGGESLLQQTARRVSDPTLFDAPMVVANIEHRFVVAEQLRKIGMVGARMILEPVGRNTAPAAAVAAILAARADPDSVLLLTPADHDIGNTEEFHVALRAGLAAAQKGSFVLYGIEPTHPATGYGYVRMGEPASEGAIVRRVLNFKKKPEIAVAESYLAAGDYVWNSGIFLLPAQRFLDELNLLEPDMLRACEEAAAAAKRDLDFLRLDPEAFARARDVSIDYAVMERTGNAVVVPASFPWSDIGTWSSLCEAGERDEQGTVALGKVIALDTESSTSARRVHWSLLLV